MSFRVLGDQQLDLLAPCCGESRHDCGAKIVEAPLDIAHRPATCGGYLRESGVLLEDVPPGVALFLEGENDLVEGDVTVAERREHACLDAVDEGELAVEHPA